MHLFERKILLFKQRKRTKHEFHRKTQLNKYLLTDKSMRFNLLRFISQCSITTLTKTMLIISLAACFHVIVILKTVIALYVKLSTVCAN